MYVLPQEGFRVEGLELKGSIRVSGSGAKGLGAFLPWPGACEDPPFGVELLGARPRREQKKRNTAQTRFNV